MPALSRDPAGILILAAMVTGVSGTFGGFFDTPGTAPSGVTRSSSSPTS